MERRLPDCTIALFELGNRASEPHSTQYRHCAPHNIHKFIFQASIPSVELSTDLPHGYALRRPTITHPLFTFVDQSTTRQVAVYAKVEIYKVFSQATLASSSSLPRISVRGPPALMRLVGEGLTVRASPVALMKIQEMYSSALDSRWVTPQSQQAYLE
ncbi:hypothetical protein PMIN06_007088 [Paraphaeosphaeria minitans]